MSSTRPTPIRSPGETRARLHSLAIDERAVGAVEVMHFEPAVGQRRQPAVHPRHERRVDDEVGAGGAADGANAAGHDAEGFLRLALGGGP